MILISTILKFSALVTKNYSHHLPAFERTIIQENWIFAIWVDSLNVESQNQAKNILVGLPNSPIKILGKSVQGFPSYDRKQTKRTIFGKIKSIGEKS